MNTTGILSIISLLLGGVVSPVLQQEIRHEDSVMQGVAGETHVPNTKEGPNVRVEGHLRPSCDFREGLKVAVPGRTVIINSMMEVVY